MSLTELRGLRSETKEWHPPGRRPWSAVVQGGPALSMVIEAIRWVAFVTKVGWQLGGFRDKEESVIARHN